MLSCEGLVRKGHDVTLVAGPETGPEGSLWADADASGAHVVRFDPLRRSPNPIHDFQCISRLTRLFREQRFDIVHTHSSKAGILGRIAARRARVPIVVHTIHGMSFNRTQPVHIRWFYRTLERWVAPGTHAIVTVADAMIEQAVAAGIAPRERFHTIRSGMLTDAFVPNAETRNAVRKLWGVSEGDVVVGTIARLFRNKGYDEIIEVISRVASESDRIHFVWVGDGADRSRYEARLESLGLRDRVTLTGLVSPGEIPAFLSGFDILAHASKWEGLPRVLVQGLLMETPAVVFDLDGAGEVVEDGETGFVLPYPDTEGFARAILTLAGDGVLRDKIGQTGRSRCQDSFSVERMVDGLDTLYANLHSKLIG